MQLDEIAREKGARHIADVMQNLSQSPSAAYNKLMHRIDQMGRASRSTAFRLLSFVLYARRPLEMNEIVSALDPEVDGHTGSEDQTPEQLMSDEVIQLGQGFLVQVHQNFTTVVRFVHSTALSFLKEYASRCQGSLTLQDTISELVLGSACLQYLGTIPEFAMAAADMKGVETRYIKYKFSKYASSYWAAHIKGAGEDMPQIKEAFYVAFGPDGRRLSIEQLVKGTSFQIGSPLIHMLAASGLETLCRIELAKPYVSIPRSSLLIKRNANSLVLKKDGWGRLPLELAAFKGHAGIVELLIEKSGLEVSAQSALIYAARGGHLQAARSILRGRGKSDSSNLGEWEALKSAISRGHLGMVKLLLESGTLDLNKTDAMGSTLLHLASEGGNKNVVQALLDAGADVSRVNDDGDSALHLAADWGSMDAVQVLVNAKADVSKKNKAGMSPRDVAARSNYRQITAIMDRVL